MTKNFINRIRLLLHPKKESYFALYKILGFFPNHLSYYEEALRHKSSPIENSCEAGSYRNNERLEFLGDAILDAVVADIVFKKYNNRNEGFLTNTRSKIVKRETLDRISGELGLNNLIITSGRIKFPQTHILGNALEAFIGAIYLDQGYRKTYRFIEKKIINTHLNIDALVKKEVNFKSKLLEWCQKFKVDLTFGLLENFTDNENNPIFQSQVLLNSLLAGVGTGYSKKESQQQAAQMALKKIKTDKLFLNQVLTTQKKENLIC
ncbi:MAG: ribonuclease III, partial [Dysgonamonadaceae bacterium]|nr:ribonuclease III [Dysgonamonadaceae bacterium]